MPGIFQQYIAEMKKKEKAKAKDDSSISKKLKPIAEVKKKAKDDSKITQDKIEKRKELDAWARDNKPEEGWGLIDKKYKEIKLRQQYLKSKETIPWPEYLESKGLKVVKELEVKEKIDKAAPWISKNKHRFENDKELYEEYIKFLDGLPPLNFENFCKLKNMGYGLKGGAGVQVNFSGENLGQASNSSQLVEIAMKLKNELIKRGKFIPGTRIVVQQGSEELGYMELFGNEGHQLFIENPEQIDYSGQKDPIVFKLGEGKKYHIFASADEAAVDFGKCVLTGESDCKGDKYEYGCRIYQNGDGFYRTEPYTKKCADRVDHVVPSSLNPKPVAYAHTHVYSLSQSRPEQYKMFSKGDYDFAMQNETTLFLSYIVKNGSVVSVETKKINKTGDDPEIVKPNV